MPPDVAQELDVVELREPVGVVGHDGVMLAVAEADEMGERLADARLVGSDLSNVSSLRLSSLPDGSPTIVVPPPISATGLPPVSCSQCSIMIPTRLPTCSEGAVQSNPI